jgi:Na+-driven multidrug efflux pump
LIPGLIVLINAEEASILSLAAEFLWLIILFPAIICIVCVVSSSAYTTPKDIMLNCTICATSGIIIMNLIVQIYFILYFIMNDLKVDLGVSDFFNIEQILIALFTGLFAGLIRIFNPITAGNIEETQVQTGQNLPPKPNWDPRIEKLKQDIYQSNQAIQQLRKELWQKSG